MIDSSDLCAEEYVLAASMEVCLVQPFKCFSRVQLTIDIDCGFGFLSPTGYGMKNKERKGEEVCKHCSLALFYRVFAILLREVGAHARLHAGMRQAVVQRETQTGLHLHANTTRIRKGQFRIL